MKRYLITTIIMLVTIMPQLLRCQDFNDVGTVKGHVEIENHPSLGQTACRNCSFLIYRKECSRAILYVETDSDGNYKVRIGIGKWRIAMKEQLGEQMKGASSRVDMLAKDQPREFIVTSPSKDLTFDIKVNVK